MEPIDYNNWAELYEKDAQKLTPIIKYIKGRIKHETLNKEEEHILRSKCNAYRKIRKELIDIARRLRAYAKRYF